MLVHARRSAPLRLAALAATVTVALALLVAVPPPPVHAETVTLTVNSLADQARDPSAPDGTCSTGDRSDAGHPTIGHPAADDPECTLRAAVQTAAADPSGDDYEVVLPGGATYGLDHGAVELSAAGALTLRGGTRSNTVVRAAAGHRIFDVPADGGAVTLQRMTLRGGEPGSVGSVADDAGGAIKARRPLEVREVAFHANRVRPGSFGGAIDAGSDLTIVDSVFGDGTDANANRAPSNQGLGGDGGAVRVWSSGAVLTITDSTFSGNEAGRHGGAVRSSADALEIRGSAFVHNDAGQDGGALLLDGVTTDGTATIENSTLSRNTARRGGGLLLEARSSDADAPDTLVLDSVTLAVNAADDGDGLFVDAASSSAAVHGRVQLRNTIVADPDATSADCVGTGNAVVVGFDSLGHNVDSDDTCGLDAVGDHPGTDAGLEPLGDHGGPTPTHPLRADSVAIDAGDTDLAVDQRGEARPVGDADDIGAFEAPPSTGPDGPITVNSTDDQPLGAAGDPACDTGDTVADTDPAHLVGDPADDDPECTLRAAVQAAGHRDGPQTIVLPDATYALTRTGGGEDAGAVGDLDLRGDLTITGSGPAAVTVDAGAIDDRVLDVVAGSTPATVTVEGVTLTGGTSPADGGGVAVHGGALTLADVHVVGNVAPGASGHGGGLHADGGTSVTLVDARIASNQAGGSGGGVSIAAGATLEVQDSVLDGNVAGYGGGLRVDGTLDLVDSTVSANLAEGRGGGILLERGAHAEVAGTSVADNVVGDGTASAYGGGLHVADAATAVLTTTTVSGNTAVPCDGDPSCALGGGVHVARGGGVTATNVTLSGNHAGLFGGLHVLEGDDATTSRLTAVSVVGNTAVDRAAGLSFNVGAADDPVTVTDTLVADNRLTSTGELADCQLHPDADVVTDGGGNVTDGTGCAFADAHDDLAVLPLGDHGGPAPTHPLAYDSPAIDAGSGCAGCPDRDQRGVTRVDGDLDGDDAPDAGAFEYQPPSVTVDVAPATWTAGGSARISVAVTNPPTGTTQEPVALRLHLDAVDADLASDHVTLTEVGSGDRLPVTEDGGALVSRADRDGAPVVAPGETWTTSLDVDVAADAPAGRYDVVATLVDVAGDPADGAELQGAPAVAADRTDVEVATGTVPWCPAPTDRFPDDDGSVHEDAIDCAAALGIVEGYPDGRFEPGRSVTRGQAASIVARMLRVAGADLPDDPADAFVDDDGSVHEHAIDQLVAVGVLRGFVDGRVRPGSPVSRAQAASMLDDAWTLARGSSLPDGPDAFGDDDGSVHEDAIDRAAAAGIVEGYDDGRFGPRAAVTRAQLASIAVRTLRELTAP